MPRDARMRHAASRARRASKRSDVCRAAAGTSSHARRTHAVSRAGDMRTRADARAAARDGEPRLNAAAARSGKVSPPIDRSTRVAGLTINRVLARRCARIRENTDRLARRCGDRSQFQDRVRAARLTAAESSRLTDHCARHARAIRSCSGRMKWEMTVRTVVCMNTRRPAFIR